MKDIIIDNTGDLEISNGDFVISDSSEQSVKLLLISKPSDFKENPQIGCDLQNALKGKISRFLERNIIVQLEADGFKVETLDVNENGVNINGSYE